MSDIGYLIESDRWTALDKLYITQLLPTEYSINITNGFGGYQYTMNVRIWGGYLTKYSFDVHRDQVD